LLKRGDVQGSIGGKRRSGDGVKSAVPCRTAHAVVVRAVPSTSPGDPGPHVAEVIPLRAPADLARAVSPRAGPIRWQRLAGGRYAGKSLPEIMLEDPDWVLDAADTDDLDGALRAEAAEIRRRVARMRVPREAGEPPPVVFYDLRPDGSYCGMAIVPSSDAHLAEDARRAAARTDGFFDLTVLRRIAPRDERGTLRLLQAFVYHCLGERMTWQEFLDDPRNFEPCLEPSGSGRG
jgi:hypothetical protein